MVLHDPVVEVAAGRFNYILTSFHVHSRDLRGRRIVKFVHCGVGARNNQLEAASYLDCA